MLMMMTMIIKRLRLLHKRNIESINEREREREDIQSQSQRLLYFTKTKHHDCIRKQKKQFLKTRMPFLTLHIH